MKKLALVLGSLLVVGSVASAKEVVPAPVAAPEVPVQVVEKEVVVYRDREVAPAWKPNGSVELKYKPYFKKEHDSKGDKSNRGRGKLEATTAINMTENQSLDIRVRDYYGLKSTSNDRDGNLDFRVRHNYNYGPFILKTKFQRTAGTVELDDETEVAVNTKTIEVKPTFDASKYFFKNDYVKLNAAEIAPAYSYEWNEYGHGHSAGIYANYDMSLPYGFSFVAEFDRLYNWQEVKGGKDLHSGHMELTLGHSYPVFAAGRHSVDFGVEAVYEAEWAYNSYTKEAKGADSKWMWYTAKLDPSVTYNFKATDYVTLSAKLGAEYINDVTATHHAKDWRWNSYGQVGMKVTF